MSRPNQRIVITVVCSAMMAFCVQGRNSAQEQAKSPEGAKTPAVTMATGQGKTMTLTMQTLPDSRGYQYCELVFNYGDKGSDIYSTSPLAKADLDW